MSVSCFGFFFLFIFIFLLYLVLDFLIRGLYFLFRSFCLLRSVRISTNGETNQKRNTNLDCLTIKKHTTQCKNETSVLNFCAVFILPSVLFIAEQDILSYAQCTTIDIKYLCAPRESSLMSI